MQHMTSLTDDRTKGDIPAMRCITNRYITVLRLFERCSALARLGGA